MIKTEISTVPLKPEKPKYPYLGYYNKGGIEQLVLFTSPSTGTLLRNGQEKIGYHSDTWSENLYPPLEGSITLSNG